MEIPLSSFNPRQLPTRFIPLPYQIKVEYAAVSLSHRLSPFNWFSKRGESHADERTCEQFTRSETISNQQNMSSKKSSVFFSSLAAMLDYTSVDMIYHLDLTRSR